MVDLRQRAWARWQAAAGPWCGWAICPALSMPDAHAVARAESAPEVVDLAEVLRPGGTAVVLDLDPVVGIHIAADVSRRGMAHVVLVLPRWPHADALLPVSGLLAALMTAATRLRAQPVARNVVFVLDAARQKPVRRPAHDTRVDNRYAITASDLPNLAMLRTAGITRVVKVASTR